MKSQNAIEVQHRHVVVFFFFFLAVGGRLRQADFHAGNAQLQVVVVARLGHGSPMLTDFGLRRRSSGGDSSAVLFAFRFPLPSFPL